MSRLHYLFVLAGVCTLCGVAPDHAHADTALKACPHPSATAQLRVRDFLAAEHLSGVRQGLGLAAISPERVRGLGLLAADAEKCDKLQDALRAGDVHGQQGQVTFFEADGFYFVTISHPSPRSSSGAVIQHEGSSQMYVFDSQFRPVARLLA
jgi:hypothetical protein